MEVTVRVEEDPSILGQTGYALLQRYGLRELPVHEGHLNGYFDMGGGATLNVYPKAPPQVAPMPPFQGLQQILELARVAYGRAWLNYQYQWARWLGDDPSNPMEGPPGWEDRFRETIALDGLRAVFLEMDDFAGFRLVEAEYFTCADDWPERAFDAILPIEQNFRESAAFLRGFEAAAARETSAAVEEWLQRRRDWRSRMDELLTAIRMAASAESAPDSYAENLLSRFADLVDQLTADGPEDALVVAERRARGVVGKLWDTLPNEVKRLVVDGEYLRPLIAKANLDWFPVVIAYSRGVEVLLRRIAINLNQALSIVEPSIDWPRAMIGDFATLFGRPNFANLKLAATQPNTKDLAALAPHLTQVSRLRNAAAHGEGRVEPHEARNLRDLLFGQKAKLFERLAQAALIESG